MMRAFLRERFPSLDADDIIQETFIALAKALPHYVYKPEEKGHFHNYLTGILRNKALKVLVARNRDALIKERVARDVSSRIWSTSVGGDVPSRGWSTPVGGDGPSRGWSTPVGGDVLGAPLEGCSASADDDKQWRESVYEIALQQLLADESIHERTKQVFVRLAVDGEKPAVVAESFGIPYNTVIKMKERTLERLRKYVEALKSI